MRNEMAQHAAQIASDHQSLWLALALTEGLGPTRARRLVEHFGTIESVFRASLTELEATGIQAVSAQALAPASSLGLPLEGGAKAGGPGREGVPSDDPINLRRWAES